MKTYKELGDSLWIGSQKGISEHNMEIIKKSFLELRDELIADLKIKQEVAQNQARIALNESIKEYPNSSDVPAASYIGEAFGYEKAIELIYRLIK
jgi:hypothetical protein